MSDADVDRVGRWLFGQRRALAEWHRDRPSGASGERLDGALAGVEALAAVGAITRESSVSWSEEFARAAAAGRVLSTTAPEDVQHHGEALAEQLLACLLEDPDEDDENFERFDGAVELLGAIGAIDPLAWDARMRERAGWPTQEAELEETRRLNAGATEVELLAVIAGPGEPRKGHRLIAALRFSDGISFLIDKDDAPDFEWPDWRLADDLGTDYRPDGSGGSDHDEHVSFRTAVPDQAAWVELVCEQDAAIGFRVTL